MDTPLPELIAETRNMAASMRESHSLGDGSLWFPLDIGDMQLSPDLLDRLADALLSQSAKIERLEAALKRCRAQFAWYAGQHRAKSPPDEQKAAVNDEYAGICRQALGDVSNV